MRYLLFEKFGGHSHLRRWWRKRRLEQIFGGGGFKEFVIFIWFEYWVAICIFQFIYSLKWTLTIQAIPHLKSILEPILITTLFEVLKGIHLPKLWLIFLLILPFFTILRTAWLFWLRLIWLVGLWVFNILVIRFILDFYKFALLESLISFCGYLERVVW